MTSKPKPDILNRATWLGCSDAADASVVGVAIGVGCPIRFWCRAPHRARRRSVLNLSWSALVLSVESAYTGRYSVVPNILQSPGCFPFGPPVKPTRSQFCLLTPCFASIGRSSAPFAYGTPWLCSSFTVRMMENLVVLHTNQSAWGEVSGLQLTVYVALKW